VQLTVPGVKTSSVRSACLRMKARVGAQRRIARRVRRIEEELQKSQERTDPFSGDQAIAGLINAIRQLMRAPEPSDRPIGFTADIGKKRKG